MTERFVCSAASQDRGEPVAVTASQVRGWLLVEVHGAWGKDAVVDSRLGPHLPDGWKADLKHRGIRPICIRPPGRLEPGREPDDVRLFFVVAARPGRTDGRVWTRTVPSLRAVPAVTAGVALGSEPPGWDRHRERIVMVCTNGKHDQCCANEGRPVARHLRTTRWAAQVWECSHIGGDRFAANVVVLPDSLYFGRMQPADAERILDAHAAGRVELEWYRGRSTLRFAEQAVDHALRAHLHVSGVDDVEIMASPEPGRIRARVRGVGTVDAIVERTETFLDEALTCQGPLGQRVPHYAVTEIIDVTSP